MNSGSISELYKDSEESVECTVELSDEEIRLGSKGELKTVILLSVGPLISQLAGAMYGVVNTVWISKAIGDQGLAAISTYTNFETISRGFAYFLQVAAAAKISALFGAGLAQEAAQVFSDLLRMSFVCMLVASATCIPAARPCIRWFGTNESVVQLGFEYILPNLLLTFMPCIYLTACGCLQAEGRSWLFCIAQVVAVVLDMLVLCPLFLLVFKTGICGAAFATSCSEFIPGIVVVIMFYRGKFGIKPHPRDLLKKLSPHTLDALKIGGAQLLFQVSDAIPGMIIRKFFGLACNGDANKFSDVMAGFNTFNRFWLLILSVPNALTIGFIPAASYAYGAQRFKRVLLLLVHTLWISVSWCAFTLILTVGFPRPISMLFSSTPSYLDWCVIIVRNGTLCSFLVPIPIIATALLQSQQKGFLATIVSFLSNLVPLPIISAALYYTSKYDVGRLIYSYPIKMAVSLFIAAPFAIYCIKDVFTKHTANGENEKEIENIDQDVIDMNEKLEKSSDSSTPDILETESVTEI